MRQIYQVELFIRNCCEGDDTIIRRDLSQFGTVTRTSYRQQHGHHGQRDGGKVTKGFGFVNLSTSNIVLLEKILYRERPIRLLPGGDFRMIQIEYLARDNRGMSRSYY